MLCCHSFLGPMSDLEAEDSTWYIWQLFVCLDQYWMVSLEKVLKSGMWWDIIHPFSILNTLWSGYLQSATCFPSILTMLDLPVKMCKVTLPRYHSIASKRGVSILASGRGCEREEALQTLFPPIFLQDGDWNLKSPAFCRHEGGTEGLWPVPHAPSGYVICDSKFASLHWILAARKL